MAGSLARGGPLDESLLLPGRFAMTAWKRSWLASRFINSPATRNTGCHVPHRSALTLSRCYGWLGWNPTPTLSRDFNEFVALLNAHGVEYLEMSGHGMALHGRPRQTPHRRSRHLDLPQASSCQPLDGRAARVRVRRRGALAAGFRTSPQCDPTRLSAISHQSADRNRRRGFRCRLVESRNNDS